MNDWHVGSRGYQAPEILLRQQDYDKKVDVFSMGVVLFILLGGYPPFEHAKESDKWYQLIVKKKYKHFWKSHRNCGMRQEETDLITRMICFDPKRRISIDKIKKHSWFTNKDVVSNKDLIKIIRYRHTKMEMQRHNDPCYQKILQNSVKRPVMNPLIHLQEAMEKYKLTLESNPPSLSDQEAVSPYSRYTLHQITAIETLFGLKALIEDELKGVLLKPDNGVLCENDEYIHRYGTGTYIGIPNFSLLFKVCLQDLEILSEADIVFIGVEIRHDNMAGCNLLIFTRIDGSQVAFEHILQVICEKDRDIVGLPGENSVKILQDLKSDELQEMYMKCFAVHKMVSL